MATFILLAVSDERFVSQDDGYVCAWDMWIGNSVRNALISLFYNYIHPSMQSSSEHITCQIYL